MAAGHECDPLQTISLMGTMICRCKRRVALVFADCGLPKESAMSFNTSFVMSHLPIIGAVVTFVVFFLLMRLCIRKIDQEEEQAEQADWWDDEEVSAEHLISKPPA